MLCLKGALSVERSGRVVLIAANGSAFTCTTDSSYPLERGDKAALIAANGSAFISTSKGPQ